MSTRSRACDITPKVRASVLERDHHRCIICGAPRVQLAHAFINRSHGGLGVERNLVSLCIEHHMFLDNGKGEKSNSIKDSVQSYLRGHYGDIDLETLKYRKG